ncbi:MAG: hypothetical protein HW388_323 [Dehalococcoidia bacterium]|nr:hypothetical protein [Dehalococcoidia bacterium]
MSEAKYDLGLVEAVKAEALGVPGQRRFRLLVNGPWGDVCLWLEKEQLFQLAIAIRQVLAALSSEKRLEKTSRHEPRPLYPDRTSMEFKVGRLSLDHEPEEGLFLIQAHNIEDDQKGEALLGFRVSPSQLQSLAEEAMAVCEAGRPLCPLCSAPMGPGPHVCSRSNGHHSL